MNEKRLHIWTPVWGRHIDLWEKYSLPSISVPGDIDILLDVYTKAEDQRRVAQIISTDAPYPQSQINVHQPNDPEIMLWALRSAAANAREHDCRLFVAMPDVIFGNGAIRNLLAYATGKQVSVACGHLRVCEEDLISRFPDGLSGAELPHLVKVAFSCAHQNTLMSWSNNKNGSCISGVTLTKISPTLVSMTHRLPTIYLTDFTDADVDYFNRAPGMSCWDHDWPKTLLNGRLRVIGSSDLFFAIELTPRDSHHVHIVDTPEGMYHKHEPHHQLNSHFVTLLRMNSEE